MCCTLLFCSAHSSFISRVFLHRSAGVNSENPPPAVEEYLKWLISYIISSPISKRIQVCGSRLSIAATFVRLFRLVFVLCCLHSVLQIDKLSLHFSTLLNAHLHTRFVAQSSQGLTCLKDMLKEQYAVSLFARLGGMKA